MGREWFKNFSRKDLITVIVLAVTVLAVVILAIVGVGPFLKIRTLLTGEPSDINLLSNQDAYHVALEKALAWQPDAKLSSMKSALGETGVSGRSDWDLLFVSKSIKKKGFQVAIRNRAVKVAEEINFTGQGTELPTNIISSKEAVAKAHDIPGYGKEPVLGVEMVYGPDGSVWYWGVKTARGTITINAKK